MDSTNTENRVVKIEKELKDIKDRQSETEKFIKELRSELFGSDNFKREGLIDTLKTIESILSYFKNTKVVGAFLVAYLVPFIYFMYKFIEWVKSLN